MPEKALPCTSETRTARGNPSPLQILNECSKVCATGTMSRLLTTGPSATKVWRFGTAKGAGSVSLLLSKFGRTSGNCRLSIGSKELDRAKELRKVLLKSQWFHDAGGSGGQSGGWAAEH